MRILRSTVLKAAVLAMFAMSCPSVGATPLSGLQPSYAFAQPIGENSSFIVLAQYRRRGGSPVPAPPYSAPGRHYDRGDDTEAMAATGIFGLILGVMIASEARRQQQATAYCAQRFDHTTYRAGRI